MDWHFPKSSGHQFGRQMSPNPDFRDRSLGTRIRRPFPEKPFFGPARPARSVQTEIGAEVQSIRITPIANGCRCRHWLAEKARPGILSRIWFTQAQPGIELKTSEAVRKDLFWVGFNPQFSDLASGRPAICDRMLVRRGTARGTGRLLCATFSLPPPSRKLWPARCFGEWGVCPNEKHLLLKPQLVLLTANGEGKFHPRMSRDTN